ncbi:proline-specific peptidase [Dichomitus squalens]|uniref:Proline-specific peptidase n=1 Tax=Dichomitus squalens TaxID=114155 RepID=A0A4Q9PB17_9APHY|nr:proline-specific peptidase [Dichomitus squalens]
MEGYLHFTLPSLTTTCKTWYKVFGDLQSPTRRPLVVIHGGPGVVHNYLLSLADLVSTHGIPIVLYDQIGNGNSTHFSEKKGDTLFWTEELFLSQLRDLLEQLGIRDNFDLLGHSWGGMLGARFATSRPSGLKRLVIASAPATMKLWVEAANSLRAQLPLDVQAILDKHEADGTTETKEYQDAVGIYYSRHLCRLDPMPKDVTDVFAALQSDQTVYLTMLGPSEFTVTGSLKNWSILEDISKIEVPTLLLNSVHDEAQDAVIAPYFHSLRKVKWFTFAKSSHMPQYEEREKYMHLVGAFLTDKA